MVFSSIPMYLDPPSWPLQQPNLEPGGGGVLASNDAPQLLRPAPAPLGGPGSIRPGSMAERAHMANIPMPESGQKCPRCESTNTKFCYFNNYSLSQPRHFCKTCRRYWTCGGALRNVPVGGGCRRNKRSKRNNRSKCPAATAAATSSTTSSGCGGISSTSSTSTTVSADVVTGHNLPPPGPSQLFPFLPPLYSINDYVPGNVGFNVETSRKIGGIDMEFQTGSIISGGGAILPNGAAEQQWRHPQFPFSGSNNPQTSSSSQVGFYQIEGVQGTSSHQVLSKPHLDPARISAVKMDETNRGLNRSAYFSGTPETGQYWLGTTDTGTVNAWSGDQSHGFSSSTSHLP